MWQQTPCNYAAVGSEAIYFYFQLTSHNNTPWLLPVNIANDIQWGISGANFIFKVPYDKFPTVQCVMSGCPVSW